MTTTRHEFLAWLHEFLDPKVYLEIGVQHGTSLRLAQPGCAAYGVDPDPLIGWGRVFRATSDQFFAAYGATQGDGCAVEGFDPAPLAAEIATSELFRGVDLGFIDGMHLVEYALRDFIGMERLCQPARFYVNSAPGTEPVQAVPSPSVVVFDDVLPRNQIEAARTQCPGDWTGDVWRIDELLQRCRPDLDTMLVDTFPTGLLVVTNLNPSSTILTDQIDQITQRWPAEDTPVPAEVLERGSAVSADRAKRILTQWRGIVQAQQRDHEIFSKERT